MLFFFFACLVSCGEVFKNDPKPQLNLEQLFKTIALAEQDIQLAASQWGTMFESIIKMENSTDIMSIVANMTNSTNSTQLIELVNLAITQVSQLELFLHERLQNIDFSDPEVTKQLGCYVVAGGLFMKFVSIKKILKFIFT